LNNDSLSADSFSELREDDHDRRAYTDLIKQYSKQLFAFGYRFCPDEDIVKDCIQQLFTELWNRRFDISETSTIKSYLFKAIRNRVLREKDKWLKNEALNDEYDFVLEFSVDNKLIAEITDQELAEKMKRVIQSLPPRQREIVYLKFYEDLDIQQISQIMNINRQSAHNLLQKAYQGIRSDWSVSLLLITALAVHQQ
jgi:RNA polymerase sigma factor (sigma-70 family)